jgi:hypothetical protein
MGKSETPVVFHPLMIIALLLALVAVLASIHTLYTLSASWRFTLATRPGELAYAAGFDGFSDEWEQSSGRRAAEIADGVMRLSVEAEDSGVFTPALPVLEDFDLTVTARAVGGPVDNSFGVVFRLANPRSYYAFYISSDGYYKVERSVDGVQKELSNWIASDAIRLADDADGSGTIDTGEAVDNVLRVVADGDRFQFYVNGTRLALCIPDDPNAASTYSAGTCFGGQMRDTLIDSALAAGRIGLGAATTPTGGPGVIVEFDNLVVFGPDPIE